MPSDLNAFNFKLYSRHSSSLARFYTFVFTAMWKKASCFLFNQMNITFIAIYSSATLLCWFECNLFQTQNFCDTTRQWEKNCFSDPVNNSTLFHYVIPFTTHHPSTPRSKSTFTIRENSFFFLLKIHTSLGWVNCEISIFYHRSGFSWFYENSNMNEHSSQLRCNIVLNKRM